MLANLVDYYRTYGINGPTYFVAHKFTGHPALMRVPYRNRTIYLRPRTSDHCVYQETIVNEDYGFDLGFEPKTIVDLGANIGLSSVFFALCYPSTSILAVEPNASNFGMLQRNTTGLRVSCVRAAVTDHNGEVSMSDSAWDKWACRVSDSGEKVQSLTLDDLCPEAIDLLKVDVEGSEKEIFTSANLTRVRAVVVETHERFVPGCEQAVRHALRDFKVTASRNMLFGIRF
jgi:FkbM family methyltransferase